MHDFHQFFIFIMGNQCTYQSNNPPIYSPKKQFRKVITIPSYSLIIQKLLTQLPNVSKVSDPFQQLGGIYQGCQVKQKPHGIGRLYFKKFIFQGKWIKGNLNSGHIITEKGIYQGNILKLKPEGKGVFKAVDQIIYEGQWKDGLPHGYGTQWEKTGNRFTGEFLFGKRHGKGLYVWKDDSWFQGVFRQGKIIAGEYQKNGQKFVGQFENNYISKGTYKFKGNKSFKGQWVKGVKRKGIYSLVEGQLQVQFDLQGKMKNGYLLTREGKRLLCLFQNNQLVEQKQLMMGEESTSQIS